MCVLHLVPVPLIDVYTGDDNVQEGKQKRQCISSEEHPEKPLLPQSNKSVPQNEPFNLASGDIPDEIESEIKPIKIIFDYMSKGITKLRAEKEEHKTTYLA
jgi:hypothetical protein